MSIVDMKMSIRWITGGKQCYPRIDDKDAIITAMRSMNVMNDNNPSETSSQWIDNSAGKFPYPPFKTSVKIGGVPTNLTCAKTSASGLQFGMTIPKCSPLWEQWMPIAAQASQYKEPPTIVNMKYDTGSGVITIVSYGENQLMRVMPKEEIVPAVDNTDSEVYFAYDRSRELIKIGNSKNVDKRRSTINGYNPGVVILKTMPGGRVKEKQLHRQFSDLHHSGEWFHYGKALKNYISAIV